MTPVFSCGAECGVSGSHWTLSGATFTTSSPIAGTRSIQCNPTAAAHNAVTVSTFALNGIVVFRFRVKFTSLPNADVVLGMDQAGGASAGAYFKTSDSKIYAGTSTANLGATGVSVTTDVLYWIDVRVNRTANPWLVDVQVNGSAAGQHSRALTAETTARGISLGNFQNATFDALFDDCVLSGTSDDYPIGNGFVNHFICTADGTHNIAGTGDFQRGNTGTDILNATTTAFQLIDDVPIPSGTVDQADNWRAVAPANPSTDYVEAVFGPAPGISAPSTAPRAVDVILAHHQIATQTGQMIVRLNDNGTTDNVFDTGAAAGVTTYRYAHKHYAAGPAGPWVIGGGGNGDFTDLRVRFLAPDAAPDQCLDAIMIEAEFAEVVVANTELIGRPYGAIGQRQMNQILIQ